MDSDVFAKVVDLVLVDCVHPVRPLILVAIVRVVIDGSSVELCWQDLFVGSKLGQLLDTSIEDLLEVLVDGSAALRVASDAQRPDG